MGSSSFRLKLALYNYKYFVKVTYQRFQGSVKDCWQKNPSYLAHLPTCSLSVCCVLSFLLLRTFLPSSFFSLSSTTFFSSLILSRFYSLSFLLFNINFSFCQYWSCLRYLGPFSFLLLRLVLHIIWMNTLPNVIQAGAYCKYPARFLATNIILYMLFAPLELSFYHPLCCPHLRTYSFANLNLSM